MIYEFGEYQLDTEKQELRLRGEVVAVEPQVFSLLLTLIEHRELVLSKDRLIELIWGGRPLSDTVVSSRIKSARRAVGDDGSAQRIIKTVHKRGFRFVADVRVLGTKRSVTASLAPPHQTEIDEAAKRDRRPCIVVLPFRRMQPASGVPVLADGFALDIILGLSRLRWIKVISWASSSQFESGTQAETIVTQTGAKYSLNGTIECVGTSLALTVELANMVTRELIWADRLTGVLNDLHELRSEIVNKAVVALEVQISSNEAHIAQLTAPENLDSWGAYHLAMAHLYRFSEADNAKAQALFSKAIDEDPLFARAHAGLSCGHYQAAFNRYGGCDVAVAALEARRSAERGIERDAKDAFTNFAMGRCHWLEVDVEGSIPWLERALSVNPNYAQAYYAHGLAAVMVNNEHAAGHDAAQAIELSPMDPFLFGFYGVRAFSYFAAGDFESARTWANHAARQPGALLMLDLMAAVANSLAGHDEEAAIWATRARKRRPDITADYFLRALPFRPGVTRDNIARALKKHKL